ncbi:MAG: VPLPA-CTERM sorting domain-containing protein [Pseudomonadota bacterium]
MAATSAPAAIITFFAEDLAPGAGIPAALATEQTNFTNAISGSTGIEDFEGVAPGTTVPFALSFPGTDDFISATLNGGGATVLDTPTTGDQSGISGTNFLQTTAANTSGFTIDFSSPISGLSFFGTDIGDIGASLTLRLTSFGGGTVDVAVGNTVGGPSGSLLFFGFFDDMDSYTSVQFITDVAINDDFGFDDFTIVDSEAVRTIIPLPASAFMLIGAVAGLGLIRRVTA